MFEFVLYEFICCDMFLLKNFDLFDGIVFVVYVFVYVGEVDFDFWYEFED